MFSIKINKIYYLIKVKNLISIFYVDNPLNQYINILV